MVVATKRIELRGGGLEYCRWTVRLTVLGRACRLGALPLTSTTATATLADARRI